MAAPYAAATGELKTLKAAAESLGMAPSTLQSAARNRGVLPGPTVRRGLRKYYDAAGFAALSAAVAKGREHGFFPRVADGKGAA